MTIEGSITGPNSANLDDEVRLSGMDLTLAMSEWMKAKEVALASKKPFTEPRPNSRAYLDLKGAELAAQREKAFKIEQEKLEVKRKKDPEFFENISNRPPEKHVVGMIEIKEEIVKKRSQMEMLLRDPEIVKALKDKLKSVYEHTPDPKNFIGMSDASEGAEFYSEQTILGDIRRVEDVRFNIDSGNSLYGESLKKRREAGFEKSEIFQMIVIDRLNDGWIPEMKATRTHDFDDLDGKDAVMQYKKHTYFAASLDMTINPDPAVIEEKMQKNWDRYIMKGILPRVKYYEDPENSQNRGKRIMPIFVIGGSPEDLEYLANAYLEDNLSSVADHPLKYTIVSQIEAQLDMILEFYFNDENSDNPKFDFARKHYARFSEFFQQVKESIQYKQKENQEDIRAHRENNVIYKTCRNFIPRINNKLAA